MEIKTYTKDELKQILELHSKYLRGETGGSRANLSGAILSGAYLSGANLERTNLERTNLRSADLSGTNLSGANLERAYLSGANLRDANLSGANLERAYLSGANLSGAILSGAYLRSADLSGTNLSGAYLSGADLSGTNLSGANLERANLSGANLRGRSILAQGSILGFKKLRDGIVATLEIAADVNRTYSLVGRKCRAASVKVLKLDAPSGKEVTVGESLMATQHGAPVYYEVGATVTPLNGFSDDIRIECAPGIHFFITKEEAESYTG